MQCLPWRINGSSTGQNILCYNGTRRFITVSGYAAIGQGIESVTFGSLNVRTNFIHREGTKLILNEHFYMCVYNVKDGYSVQYV